MSEDELEQLDREIKNLELWEHLLPLPFFAFLLFVFILGLNAEFLQ